MSEVVWIAGVGASAGLGAALARRFARGGFAVALTARNAGRLAELRKEIADLGEVHGLAGDISVPSQVDEIAARVAKLGTLKVAVFNAGNAVRGNLLELSPEAFEATWRGGTFAGFLFARESVRLLLQSGGGSLLFTGATASIRGRGPFTAFASAKAGLRSLAQSAAREYGPRNIHVAHVVIDGGIDGEQVRRNAPQFAASAGADGLLSPDAIAETYWQLHQQSRSAWTHELDLRPYKESF
ncbi:MAG TPA: SDR family NAD(P)-dependent oxidoreductase [Steroidobacteraceae bacterium]|jgi:NAD(P)-dependent dehydrogenase (short-subunit alcohol dehydrogenase family)